MRTLWIIACLALIGCGPNTPEKPLDQQLATQAQSCNQSPNIHTNHQRIDCVYKAYDAALNYQGLDYQPPLNRWYHDAIQIAQGVDEGRMTIAQATPLLQEAQQQFVAKINQEKKHAEERAAPEDEIPGMGLLNLFNSTAELVHNTRNTARCAGDIQSETDCAGMHEDIQRRDYDECLATHDRFVCKDLAP